MLLRVKKLVLASCLMIVAHGVWAAPVLLTSEHDIYEYKLENGLKVVLAPNQKESKVYMNTIYFVGSLHDPKAKGGLAHLLEHLAFKGTENIKGDEYQRQLDQFTLGNNASTDYHSTRYINLIRPDQTSIDKIIQLEAERMDKLVLQERFVPTEIEIVRREREIRLDQPFSVLIDQTFKAAYGNQHLGRLPIGDLDELKSINMQELQQFYHTYYAPNNATIVITGKFDLEKVLASIEKQFGHLKAKTLPARLSVPELDPTKIQPRKFEVKKGSDLAKFDIYLDQSDVSIQPTLALIPYLYAMEPSGLLYKNMVENGLSTGVFSNLWLSQNFNLVFMGAVYAPTQDAKNVENTLTALVEKKPVFNQKELSRIKNLFNNEYKKMLTDSVAVGSRLSDYVVSSQGQWQKFFLDQKAVLSLEVDQVNTQLGHFLKAEHRIHGDIRPTPEDQKKAQQLVEQEQVAKSGGDDVVKEEPLKDPSVYKQEVVEYVKSSAKRLGDSERKIQRGQLLNGMKYAFYPTDLRDDRVYATIELDYGDEKSLFNQSAVIELTAYLLMRGSDKYTLEQILDKSIELDGSASVSSNNNSMSIKIAAHKDNFEKYFDFVIDVIQKPKFDQKEFDLARNQSLQSLDRPYTEPETVAGLQLSRILEKYQPGDLRYHFEPDMATKQLQSVTHEQVKAFYKKYFAMNHARISVTGEFDAKLMLRKLKKDFEGWNTKVPYMPMLPSYKQYSAQKQHVLAEQREFGNYQSVQAIPVGIYHPDAPALIILSHIMSDSQLSSRLAQALREKTALVYGFGSAMSLHDKKDVGAFSIVANYTSGRSAQVSQNVHQVLQELLVDGITEQELEAAKADILKKRATMLEDDRNIHKMLNGQLELSKTMASRAQRDVAFATLTVTDINQVIKKYIKPDQLVEVMADQYGKPIK